MEATQRESKWRLYFYLVYIFWVYLQVVDTSNVCETKHDSAIPFQLGGKCFEYVSTKMDWNSAVKFCEKYGGSLAQIRRDILTKDAVIDVFRDFNLGRSILAHLGFYTKSTYTAYWLDGSEMLYPTAPEPHFCGLLEMVSYVTDSFRAWQMADCSYKRPIICQYEPLVVTTVNPTDLITPGKKRERRRPRVKRKHKSTKKTITSQIKKEAFMVGKPLSERKCSAVTMCSRLCTTDRQCVCFNFNSVTFQCQLFDVRHNVTYADSPDWSVWSTGQCQL